MDELIPSIPRLYTALAEFFACTIYILMLKKRIQGVKFWLCLPVVLLIFCSFQMWAGEWSIYFWMVGMAVAILLMHFYIRLLTNQSHLNTLYWTARAFVLAEFAASFAWQMYYFVYEQMGYAENNIIEAVMIIFIYAIVFVGAWMLERRYNMSNISIKSKDTVGSCFIALTIFLISNVSFISSSTPLSGSTAMEIYYIRTLVDLCGIILLYGQQEQRLWLHARVEINEMQNVISRQYNQYCMSKENIDSLNLKYHDLKHQIDVIRDETNKEKVNQYLDKMELDIKKYQAQNKTGNGVLDTILTSKSMVCLDRDINLTCVANGELVNFMDIMDICSIFGNALDNAIEGVSKIEDKEQRLIKFALYENGTFIVIKVENYFNDKVKFRDGMPMTTKANKQQSHGYGVKSIRHLAEKYGGTMTVDHSNNWFTICLLLPKELKQQ